MRSEISPCCVANLEKERVFFPLVANVLGKPMADLRGEIKHSSEDFTQRYIGRYRLLVMSIVMKAAQFV